MRFPAGSSENGTHPPAGSRSGRYRPNSISSSSPSQKLGTEIPITVATLIAMSPYRSLRAVA